MKTNAAPGTPTGAAFFGGYGNCKTISPNLICDSRPFFPNFKPHFFAMKEIPRRKFIGQAALATGAGILASSFKSNSDMADNKTFIHHVYFWLKNPDSKEDLDKLIAGLKKLSKVKSIASFHIGRPAPTRREVIDSSYSVSWCLFFKTPAEQDSYQTDPIHLKFVEECSSLWTKVVVYDSIDI